jgi:hypothetical protein
MVDYKMFHILNSVYTDLSSCRQCFVTVPIVGLHNKLEEYSTWISPSVAGSGCWSPFCVFWSLHCLPRMLKNKDCSSGFSIPEDVGVGDKWSGDTTIAVYKHSWTNYYM